MEQHRYITYAQWQITVGIALTKAGLTRSIGDRYSIAYVQCKYGISSQFEASEQVFSYKNLSKDSLYVQGVFLISIINNYHQEGSFNLLKAYN